MEITCPRCGRSDFKNQQAKAGHLAHCQGAPDLFGPAPAVAALRGHDEAIDGADRHARLARRWRGWTFFWTLATVAVVGVTAGVAGGALVGLVSSAAAEVTTTMTAPLVLVGLWLSRWAASRWSTYGAVTQAFLHARAGFEAHQAGTAALDEAACTLRAARILESLAG